MSQSLFRVPLTGAFFLSGGIVIEKSRFTPAVYPKGKMSKIEKLEKITGKKHIMGVKEALLQEGEKRGIRKGEKLGIQKGEKLEREKRNYMFVKNLLKQTTFSVPMIASLSGTSEAFVRKVKKDLNK